MNNQSDDEDITNLGDLLQGFKIWRGGQVVVDPDVSLPTSSMPPQPIPSRPASPEKLERPDDCERYSEGHD
jgi:hypothetical protein